jgi:hypothetical protein
MYQGRPAYIEQLNNISFWYPILADLSAYSKMPEIQMFRDESGKLSSSSTQKDFVLNIPETKLFYAPREIGQIIDGKKVDSFDHLIKDVYVARESFGGEAFLRTGHTSNKHGWDHSCHLKKGSNIGHYLGSLIDFSMMVDLPYTTFAVRRMIDTVAETVAFDGMPIAREVRVFAEDGKVTCAHPYWPDEAFEHEESVTAEQLERLQEMPDMEEITKMAEYVSRQFVNAWSIDFLQDSEGKWWLIDMALASTSYHWPDCEKK